MHLNIIMPMFARMRIKKWRCPRAREALEDITLKSSLEVRPIYHWTDRRIEAHVFVCFLGLVMARELEMRLNRGSEPKNKGPEGYEKGEGCED